MQVTRACYLYWSLALKCHTMQLAFYAPLHLKSAIPLTQWKHSPCVSTLVCPGRMSQDICQETDLMFILSPIFPCLIFPEPTKSRWKSGNLNLSLTPKSTFSVILAPVPTSGKSKRSICSNDSLICQGGRMGGIWNTLTSAFCWFLLMGIILLMQKICRASYKFGYQDY